MTGHVVQRTAATLIFNGKIIVKSKIVLLYSDKVVGGSLYFMLFAKSCSTYMDAEEELCIWLVFLFNKNVNLLVKINTG